MIQLQEMLAAHPFFAGLDPSYLALMAGCATNRRFEPGQYLFRAGEPADCFYVLRHGLVTLEVHVPHRGAVAIQTVSEGDVLGWSWLVPPHHWHFDGRAEQVTVAISLDGKCLRAKCEADPRLGFELMKRFTGMLAKRLEATRLQLMDVYGGGGDDGGVGAGAAAPPAAG